MDRRQLLTGFSAGATLAIAGCSGTTSEDTPDSTDQPTATQSSTPTDSPTPTATEEPTPTPEPAEFVVSALAPDSAELGESIEIEVEVENSGGQTGTWEGVLEIGYGKNSNPSEIVDTQELDYSVEVPAGETRIGTTGETSFSEPFILFYRIGDRDYQTIEIPDSQAPIIVETNLVSEWQSYGDAVDNRITQAEVGSVINIAARYWYWAENQTLDVFRQARVFDPSGERIDIDTTHSEQVIENNGWSSWEASVSFDATGWDAGQYSADVLIRDEQTQEVSTRGSVEFEIVEPS